MQIFDGQIRFGIHYGAQQTTWDAYLELVQSAERWGFDWVSTMDHFLPSQGDPDGPCFEGMTVLSAIAALTTRVRCGVMVACAGYRNPAVMAKMTATIDHICGGRLELGLGSGWLMAEYDQYGFDFGTPGSRGTIRDEVAEIILGMWTQPKTTFHGKYHTITDAQAEPKPLQTPHPPLWLGGGGEKRTLRAVARFADGWNTPMMPEDSYRSKLAVLAGHCAEIGRDPDDVRKSILVLNPVIAETQAEAKKRAETAARGARSGAIMRSVVGTPEQVVDFLIPYAKLGVGDFLAAGAPPTDDTLELLATRVAPMLRSVL